MEATTRCSYCLFFAILILALLPPPSVAQLTPFENRILFRVQQLLEFPPAFQGWNNWTNFCYLPPSPSLTIVCSGNHVTELTVIGNRSSPSVNPKPASGRNSGFAVSEQTLSQSFLIDSFFTTLTKLASLKVLTLVSLGIWGPLPPKINRFRSLQVLNISFNFIYGQIPPSISTFKNLSSLVLADNLFNGTVPDLTSLAVLKELDLSGNLLGPKFPSLGNKLVTIILKNNTFQSEFRLDFKKFDALQRLDISSNQLNGPIPTALFSMPSIQYLNLARNKLTGALPTTISCSDKLGFVDLSNNLLTGRLPSCIGSNSSNRVVLYSWNCLSSGNSSYQHPTSFCDQEALAVKPTTTPKTKHHSSSKLGLIPGIGGGIVGGVIALGLLLLVIFRMTRSRKHGTSSFNKHMLNKPSAADTRYVSHTMRLGALELPPYHEFTMEEIEEATNNFDQTNLLGQGSYGQLYKGWLGDGSAVAVRCLKLKNKHSPQSLLQHMEVISKLRHRHLVGILGHCIVTFQDHPNAANTLFLVLEHVSNGALRSHLTDWRRRETLKWPQRMAINIGVARGIQFLHTGISPGIFGNDLKIENILLDDNFTPKISSYNLPLPARVSSN
uniref:Protein kinase domain-containing protein n=1 Tax=Nelumbo nucifera TaxID=4432 RepID=A0A822YQI1_NELNU|nr:TPA_asm: hypothetical protein HUJ06_005450 [Nelumbo nucifera]